MRPNVSQNSRLDLLWSKKVGVRKFLLTFFTNKPQCVTNLFDKTAVRIQLSRYE